jgi:dihydrofolate synthase/folylpolyglutamate synthase
VAAPQHDEAMKVIAGRCEALNAPLIETSAPFEVEAAANSEDIGRYRFRYRTPNGEYAVRPGLRGRHQITNALTAIHIAERVQRAGFDIPSSAILEGLSSAQWPGRLELIRTSPSQAQLLLDGAHNADGAHALRDFLDEHFHETPITILFGVAADKAVGEMSDILFPLASQVIITRIPSPRAADPKVIAEKVHREVICIENVGDALSEALRITQTDGLVVVCGSLFLVGEVRQSHRADIE